MHQHHTEVTYGNILNPLVDPIHNISRKINPSHFTIIKCQLTHIVMLLLNVYCGLLLC